MAAIATPVGEGGIGVVEVVGPGALAVVSEVFRGKRIADLTQALSRKLYYGNIVDGGNVIDEVIVAVFRGGESFLGPEVVEINCHGGIVCVNEVMRALEKRGVKLASWQELVSGSVKQGALDRIEQEALTGLIEAKTELAAHMFLAQYQGRLSRSIRELQAALKEALRRGSPDALGIVRARLSELAESARIGLAFSRIRTVVVCGRTNVGKSSLVNALLKARRVVVDSAPGTTRDAVEVLASAEGLPVKLVDTAGLREAKDEIEIMGLRKAYESMAEADLLVGVFEYSAALAPEEVHFARELAKRQSLMVANKADRPRQLDLDRLQKLARQKPCVVSALRGWGVSQLGAEIRTRLVGSDDLNLAKPMVFTLRQEKLISQAGEELARAIEHLQNNLPTKCQAQIERAVACFEEMLGSA